MWICTERFAPSLLDAVMKAYNLLLYLVMVARLTSSGSEKITIRDLLDVTCNFTLVGGPGTPNIVINIYINTHKHIYTQTCTHIDGHSNNIRHISQGLNLHRWSLTEIFKGRIFMIV